MYIVSFQEVAMCRCILHMNKSTLSWNTFLCTLDMNYLCTFVGEEGCVDLNFNHYAIIELYFIMFMLS